MSDIVERLRAPAYWFSGSSEGHEGENSAPYEAADEIERLRAWNAEIALNARHFADTLNHIAWEQKEGDEPHLIARAALEGK